jgi:hypothetical protein
MFNQMFLRMCLQMLVHDAETSGHCQLPWLRKVSPFVNPAGQPSVILTMNAQVASALIESLRPSRTPPAGPSGADGPAGNVPFIP